VLPDRARRPLAAWLEAQGPDLALRLTLLLLLLAPVGGWEVRPFALLLAAAGLLSSALLRAPALWLLLVVLTGWRAISDWPMADNHAYLLGYWCLAVLLSRWTPDPGAALARSAALLVGLSFAFATLWKLVLSPDYLDGTFFRVWLLTDPRFEDLALLVGGLTPSELDASRHFLQPPPTLGEEHLPALVEPAALRSAAAILTWTTLALEAGVALLFLTPAPPRWPWLRHAALLGFCAGAYAVAPVASFGWLLLAMGVATCPRGAIAWRGAYLACFALLVLHDAIPWAAAALGRLQL
jgi:hypothetical protein